jgi:hypothetical protein
VIDVARVNVPSRDRARRIDVCDKRALAGACASARNIEKGESAVRDQIEQGISADQAKTPDGTRRGNGQSKSDTGSMNKTPKANQKTGTRRKPIPRFILGVVVIGVAGFSLSNPQVPMSHDLTEFIGFFAIKLFLVAIGVWLVGTSLRRGKTVRVANRVG